MSFRCWFAAWIFGWVTVVYGSSLWIAGLGLAPGVTLSGTGLAGLPANVFRVADEMGPAVKLLIGGLLLLGGYGLYRARLRKVLARLLGAATVGTGSVLATIAFIPAEFSRGFALALTGSRFDVSTTPIYLASGVLAGLVMVWNADRCARRAGRIHGR